MLIVKLFLFQGLGMHMVNIYKKVQGAHENLFSLLTLESTKNSYFYIFSKSFLIPLFFVREVTHLFFFPILQIYLLIYKHYISLYFTNFFIHLSVICSTMVSICLSVSPTLDVSNSVHVLSNATPTLCKIIPLSPHPSLHPSHSPASVFPHGPIVISKKDRGSCALPWNNVYGLIQALCG